MPTSLHQSWTINQFSCLLFLESYNLKREVAVCPLPFSNYNSLKKVSHQIGQFVFGIWSPTDVSNEAGTKGQLISKENFSDFNSPKKGT